MRKNHYDIFLSYRRVGGWETAKHLYDLLIRDGYRVSFDIDTLREGNFDKQLLGRIDECTDFVIILDAHVFDRCFDKTCPIGNDWLRNELAYALKLNKNVIPVMLAGFSEFPPNLPKDIAEIRLKNGPMFSQYYFDSFYDKLCAFLHSRPQNKVSFQVEDIHSSTLKIFTDEDCKVYIDNEFINTALKSTILHIPLCAGSYILKFISVENPFIYVEDDSFKIDEKKEFLYKIKLHNQVSNPINQFKLGEAYFKGEEVEQNYEKAVKWYTLAAEQNYSSAQIELAFCYEMGYGVKQDNKTAFSWYQKSANQNDLYGQFCLGSCYQSGFIVPEDPEKAIYWYTKAAEGGSAIAQCSLADCYDIGYGVKEDHVKANSLYTQSAEQDYAIAQYVLGHNYSTGYYVEKNLSKAIYWLKKAAEQDISTAQYELALCYEQPSNEGPNYSVAFMWLTKAAEQGEQGAQYDLANYYEMGNGIYKDLEKAKYWYEKAAEQGGEMYKKKLEQFKNMMV